MTEEIKKCVAAATLMMGGACAAMADTVIVSDSPTVVRNAELREAIRQDSTCRQV